MEIKLFLCVAVQHWGLLENNRNEVPKFCHGLVSLEGGTHLLLLCFNLPLSLKVSLKD